MKENTYDPLARVKARADRGQAGDVPRVYRENILDNARFPLSVAAAFGGGIVAMLLSRFGQVHLLGLYGVGEAPLTQMSLDLLSAAALGLIFAFMFNWNTHAHLVAKALGIVLVITSLHNFAYWTPQLMRDVFTRIYVIEAKKHSEPNSFLVLGNSFHFIYKRD